MRNSVIISIILGLPLGVASIREATGQATSQGLSLKAVAEVAVNSERDGTGVSKLAAADRVVPGDEVIYTLEIRNISSAPVHQPQITYPVPAHTRYVADSATGPGAEVSFSADGGATFERAEDLRATGSDGRTRAVTADAYTHIRWKLKATLKPKSVAFARFRAVVK